MEKNTTFYAPEQQAHQSQPSHSNSNRAMPQPVNQSYYPQKPYQNTAPPVQRVQLSSARMVSPPSDYLAWSIANTACSVLFSLWA